MAASTRRIEKKLDIDEHQWPSQHHAGRLELFGCCGGAALFHRIIQDHRLRAHHWHGGSKDSLAKLVQVEAETQTLPGSTPDLRRWPSQSAAVIDSGTALQSLQQLTGEEKTHTHKHTNTHPDTKPSQAFFAGSTLELTCVGKQFQLADHPTLLPKTRNSQGPSDPQNHPKPLVAT